MQNERKNKGKIIIGLVGTLGAGKSSAVEYLTNQGFEYSKLSKVIEEETNFGRYDRVSLQDLGNELRKKFGSHFLAKKAWEKIRKSKAKKFVVDGLRNIGEVEFFRKKGNFYLIAVDAERKSRFRRMKIRGSNRDPKSWPEFLRMEKRDLDEEKTYGQQSRKVMKMADFSISNNNPLEFFLEIHEILKQVGIKK